MKNFTERTDFDSPTKPARPAKSCDRESHLSKFDDATLGIAEIGKWPDRGDDDAPAAEFAEDDVLIFQSEMQVEVADQFTVLRGAQAERHPGEFEFAGAVRFFGDDMGVEDVHIEVPDFAVVLGENGERVTLGLRDNRRVEGDAVFPIQISDHACETYHGH